ncbi:MAG: Crp/Fnr family transcriptional regulator [Bacteroidetes bacterium]|nr:Crp/Fnr family transcriptional regulator [Bacteroidota bacterium]
MLNKTQFWHLRNHDLFDILSDSDISDLCIISNFKTGNKGDMIFFSDSDVKRLYTIKEGTLKICTNDKTGKEIISEILTIHDIFGHVALEGSKQAPKEYAKVLSDTIKVCSFEVAHFKKVLNRNPDLTTKYNSYVGDKLVDFQNKYSDLVFKDVATRLVEFFKKYAAHSGRILGSKAEMEMLLTHQEIADYIAASRQTVTQLINSLEGQGKIIYEGRKKVVIPDINNL